jgi:hypothetical protein
MYICGKMVQLTVSGPGGPLTVRLISCYMFRHNRHLQGAYTSVVRTYSNHTFAQQSNISTEQVLVGGDSLQFISQCT